MAEREAAVANERHAMQRSTALALLDGPMPNFWKEVGEQVQHRAANTEVPMAKMSEALAAINSSGDDVYPLLVRISNEQARRAVLTFHAICAELVSFVAGQPNPPDFGWASKYGAAREAYMELCSG